MVVRGQYVAVAMLFVSRVKERVLRCEACLSAGHRTTLPSQSNGGTMLSRLGQTSRGSSAKVKPVDKVS